MTNILQRQSEPKALSNGRMSIANIMIFLAKLFYVTPYNDSKYHPELHLSGSDAASLDMS